MFETLGVKQGGEQHLNLAGGQYYADEPVSDGSLGVDRDTQAVEHRPGLVRKLFGNNLFFFTAGNEGFDGIAKPHGHPNDAMGTVMLVKKRDSM